MLRQEPRVETLMAGRIDTSRGNHPSCDRERQLQDDRRDEWRNRPDEEGGGVDDSVDPAARALAGDDAEEEPDADTEKAAVPARRIVLKNE